MHKECFWRGGKFGGHCGQSSAIPLQWREDPGFRRRCSVAKMYLLQQHRLDLTPPQIPRAADFTGSNFLDYLLMVLHRTKRTLVLATACD